MDIYLKVRQACLVDGRSQRSVARLYGLNRRSVVKMLSHSVPPGYQRSERPLKPKLDPHKEFIDSILISDEQSPLKQPHTSRRILTRLKEERGFDGSYTIVREYIASQRKKVKEMFVPLFHEAGSAQVDFGEAYAIIGNIEQKVHLFVMDLPQSDACFIKAYFRENTESFCDGHVSAFDFFGGVPNSIVYDNTKIAVTKIIGGNKRVKTQAFTELQSHYLFRDRFARIGKGNDKGKVENLVGYGRRNFMVPVPRFETIEALNVHLRESCQRRQQEVLPGQKESILDRLRKDQEVFLNLPPVPYEACRLTSALVSSESLVSFRGNFYSVPVEYGYKRVIVKGYVDRIEIIYADQIIAVHNPLYGKTESSFCPFHYLPLLERKTGAYYQAAPLKDWILPPLFEKLKSILEEQDGKKGLRDYIRVLRLVEIYGLDQVEKGIEHGFQLGVLSSDGIQHLILSHKEQKPPRLNLLSFPDVPAINVSKTPLSSYQRLLDVPNE